MQRYNRIKEILETRGTKYRWLAERIGKTPASVSRYCANEVQPPLDVLFLIAKVLEVDPRDLLYVEEEDRED